jgi:hypothetical protein
MTAFSSQAARRGLGQRVSSSCVSKEIARHILQLHDFSAHLAIWPGRFYDFSWTVVFL